MLKNTLYISILFTLVFIFPLTYQPLHVILHHNKHHKHNEGISTKKEKCLAYEYHFATFDLPEEIHFNLEKLNHNSVLNTFYKNTIFNIRILPSSSRAPPVFS